MKILVPVDGSKASDHAIEKLVAFLPRLREPAQLQLLFVMGPVRPSPTVHGIALERDAIERYYQAEATAALKSAEALLGQSKLTFERLTEIGDAAETICKVAASGGHDMIWMGTRGMGGFANLLLGSVAMKVLHGTNTPVVLVPMHPVKHEAIIGSDFRT